MLPQQSLLLLLHFTPRGTVSALRCCVLQTGVLLLFVLQFKMDSRVTLGNVTPVSETTCEDCVLSLRGG